MGTGHQARASVVDLWIHDVCSDCVSLFRPRFELGLSSRVPQVSAKRVRQPSSRGLPVHSSRCNPCWPVHAGVTYLGQVPLRPILFSTEASPTLASPCLDQAYPQYSLCLCEGVAGQRPATPSHKHGLCPPFDFQQGRRCST